MAAKSEIFAVNFKLNIFILICHSIGPERFSELAKESITTIGIIDSYGVTKLGKQIYLRIQRHSQSFKLLRKLRGAGG